MATLYELNDEYARLLGELDFAETDEERDQIWSEIDSIGGSIAEKAEAYARIMRNKMAETEAYKVEKLRLGECQKRAENAAARMRATMLDTLRLTGATEIQTSIGKWRIASNPASVDVLDVDSVPAQYHITQPDTIDKAAILKEYRETGEIPDGVDIVRTEGIRFK